MLTFRTPAMISLNVLLEKTFASVQRALEFTHLEVEQNGNTIPND